MIGLIRKMRGERNNAWWVAGVLILATSSVYLILTETGRWYPDMGADTLKVFIASREAKCGECGQELGRHAWITLVENKGTICLSCADLDHLVYLPAGDATLTRRTQKRSGLSAVVLKWSRARNRYERQGLLVEEEALAYAEQECLADAEARAKRKERDADRLAEQDRHYIESFAARIKELFPSCPSGREVRIAEHACLKYSMRVGRSAEAKRLDDEAVRMAVRAHIRHVETPYDSLLASGLDRWTARQEVQDVMEEVILRWERHGPA